MSEHSHTHTYIKQTDMLNLLTVTWDVNPFILTGILLLIWSARKGGPARIQNNTVRHGANQQH